MDTVDTYRDRATFDHVCNGRAPTSKGQHPANCVSWMQAHDFCAATGARLPTEAEWELAARGTDGRRYPWGDAEPTSARQNACGAECVAWGKKRGTDLAAMYRDDDGWPTTAPAGRVLRGGSWNGSDSAWVRPTYRFSAPPEMRSHGIGFRCARALVTDGDAGGAVR